MSPAWKIRRLSARDCLERAACLRHISFCISDMTILRLRKLIKVSIFRHKFGSTLTQPLASSRNLAVFCACTDPYPNLIRRSSSWTLRPRVDEREYLVHTTNKILNISMSTFTGCSPSTTRASRSAVARGKLRKRSSSLAKHVHSRRMRVGVVPFAKEKDRWHES